VGRRGVKEAQGVAPKERAHLWPLLQDGLPSCVEPPRNQRPVPSPLHAADWHPACRHPQAGMPSLGPPRTACTSSRAGQAHHEGQSDKNQVTRIAQHGDASHRVHASVLFVHHVDGLPGRPSPVQEVQKDKNQVTGHARPAGPRCPRNVRDRDHRFIGSPSASPAVAGGVGGDLCGELVWGRP
jgi:hypothetical protein